MGLRDLVCVLCGAGDFAIPPGLKAISHGGFTVLLGGNHRQRLLRPTRKLMLRDAAKRQSVLETMMTAGTVIPVLPGMAIKATQVPEFIDANRPLLEGLVQKLGGRVQFQITVSWDAREASAHFGARDPENLAEVAGELAQEFEEMLDTVVQERLSLPGATDVILNAVVLCAAEKESDLDQVVARIDEMWSDGLRIRQIGPSPALSFCSLGLRKFSKAQIAAARRVLGVAVDATPSDIARARHAALKQAAPEAWNMLKSGAEILVAVSRSQGTTPPPLAYVWKEGRATETTQLSEAA